MQPFWANAAAAACLLIALGFASTAWPDPSLSPSIHLENMTFVASAEGENEVMLAAEQARFKTFEKVAHLQTVHALLASEGGTTGLDMRCERATIQIETNDFDAEGNVRGTTGDGKRFRTEKMRYVHGSGIVSSNSPVEIRDETGTYRGAGFRYYLRENRFQLRGAATVVQQ
jgi:LPS export ABC transporter protein LptC